MADYFEKLCSFQFLENLKVEKYKSKRTGITLCFVEVPGPLVNGYFTLATEAHDDDGLPHTLEHLVFMGSEKYPYKGLLDLFANRCLAQGTNAWTDTDHTCYTMTTAGSEGFLNLLPIYLDHILYPTLTESAYLTEVHHINEEGEDAGVVYCEMQARENTGESRTHLTFLRNMYPGYCGYKSETGGIMANLRTSCSHKKVCDYHEQFYRPENLCLLITGLVKPEDVFERMKSFEEKILSKKEREAHVRPWESDVPHLKESVTAKIQFPSDDEETGLALIGYRGPKATDDFSIEAMKVIMTYLTDSPVATLQQILVECADPYCSDVSFDFIENSEGCLYITAENVPTEKLDEIIPRITDAIQDIVEKKVEIDMKRMAALIHREILDAMDKIEDKPHYTFAGFCIGDFLYSTESNQLLDKVDTIRHLKKLADQPEDFWIGFLERYFVNAKSVTVIGEPSQKLMTEMSTVEKDRVKKQQERLGTNGLKERGERLKKANEENGIEPPTQLISSLPIPSISSINFHEVKTASNLGKTSDDIVTSCVPVNNIPFSFQLDHISSLFIEITILLDTSALPENLKDYLNLYIAVILESPVLRNGVLVSHEEIVAQLTQDTLDHGTSLGLNGRRFRPGKFPQLAALKFKIEMDKYIVAIELLRDLLYNTQFTVDRIKVVAKKMIKEVTQMKREGRTIVNALIKDNTFSSESPYRFSNFIHQQQFLNKILKEVKDNPDKVIADLSQLRENLTNRSNIRVHVTTNVNNLPKKANEIWENSFVPGITAAPAEHLPDLQKASLYLRKDNIQSKIVGVGSVESSFLVQCCRGIDSFLHPDFAPVLVFMECLIALEGPMWRTIRGLGLSYHYSMFCDPEQGLIYFILFKASHLVKAYEKAKEIMEDYLSGNVPFDAVQLESAISSVIFEIIGHEESVGDAAFENLLSQLRNVGKDYNKRLLEKISKVSQEDLKRVGANYFTRLFSVEESNCAICCHPSKVDEIQTSFQRFGRQLTVVSSLDEEMNSGSMSAQSDRHYQRAALRHGKLGSCRVSRLLQDQEQRFLPTKISLCARSCARFLHDRKTMEEQEEQNRPFMTLNLDTPSPTAYDPPTNPPNMTTSPAYTMRPKTYPEKAGGDRVSWSKEWFSNTSRWLTRTDFNYNNRWPSPTDHAPCSTIGRPQITMATSPSHSFGIRKEFTLVSKDAKSFPSPCRYNRSRSQKNVLASSPSFTITEGRRHGTLPFIARNGSSPGPGSYNPNIFKTSSTVRRPAFTIAKSPRVIGITRNCSF